MKKTLIACALVLTTTVACAPPIQSSSTRLSTASSVQLINAPEGATLRIGDAASTVSKKGTATLAVADGWHEVTVISNGMPAKSTRVFVQDGSKKVIDFSAPN